MRTIPLRLAVSLAGCAGERGGLSGGPSRIDTYAYQCDKHSVQVARDRYMDGWYEGNALYVHRTAGMEAS